MAVRPATACAQAIAEIEVATARDLRELQRLLLVEPGLVDAVAANHVGIQHQLRPLAVDDRAGRQLLVPGAPILRTRTIEWCGQRARDLQAHGNTASGQRHDHRLHQIELG